LLHRLQLALDVLGALLAEGLLALLDALVGGRDDGPVGGLRGVLDVPLHVGDQAGGEARRGARAGQAGAQIGLLERGGVAVAARLRDRQRDLVRRLAQPLRGFGVAGRGPQADGVRVARELAGLDRLEALLDRLERRLRVLGTGLGDALLARELAGA